MVDESTARSIANAIIDQEIAPKARQDLVITSVSEHPYCWVVTYNTKRFVETGSYRDALAGNGLLIVNRRTGAVRQGVSGRPVEEQLDLE